jgi:translation initiation factor IF-1
VTLEERIDRIFNTGEIELAGEAYKGKYELNNVRSIKGFILKKLRKVYINLSTGDKMTLSHDSAGKLAIQYKDSEAYQKSIAHIPEIIENMQFLEEMKPSKENAKYDKYSYYITPVKIDGESHAVLSTVGHKGQKIYYSQNVFKGTPKEVFANAKNETCDTKYSRLNEILKDVYNKNGDWELYQGSTQGSPTAVESTNASTNKYTKNSGDAQGEV